VKPRKRAILQGKKKHFDLEDIYYDVDYACCVEKKKKKKKLPLGIVCLVRKVK